MSSEGRTQLLLKIEGIVQGVGFRPTVYRLANRAGLTGWVQNRAGCVMLCLEAACSDTLHLFVDRLPEAAPFLARIDSITLLHEREIGASAAHPSFLVLSSDVDEDRRTTIPADVVVCDACMKEVLDPAARRYGYSFTTCTHCGPRYTVVRSLPYDRERTAMAAFPLCAACRAEYEDPADRRFHAESLACPDCGPQLSLLSKNQEPMKGGPLQQGRRLLAEGRIVAVKGIGGFLLAVDATHRDAIQRLRHRKQRPAKPLALMMRDVATVARQCVVGDAARLALTGANGPIVLLDPRNDCALPVDLLAPDAKTLGIMLPTSPLHRLLLSPLEGDSTPEFLALVMTSGNRSAEPICLAAEEAYDRLNGIADAYLVHNRKIELRCDDSVVAIRRHAPQLWRRARGYAPQTVALPCALACNTVALGADLKNVVALGWERIACPSPHIGDLSTAEACDALRLVLQRLPEFLGRPLEAVVVDLHPDMHATGVGETLAAERELPLLRVQHHYAHAAGCLAEHGSDHGLVLSFDGNGWGEDGTVWGAELIAVDARQGFRWLGTFAPAALPGGDSAVWEPVRQLVGRFLDYDIVPPADWLDDYDIQPEAFDAWRRQVARGINTAYARSAGRLFDSVSAMLRVAPKRVSYEGEAAIRLESVAREASGPVPRLPYRVLVSDDKRVVVDWRPAFECLSHARDLCDRRAEWALAFHVALADAAAGMVRCALEREAFDTVGLTGGVFMNRLLINLLVPRLQGLGVRVLQHRQIPPNDGGIAYGQLAAAALLRMGLPGGRSPTFGHVA